MLGLYLHGLFENPAVLQALFGHGGHDLETTFTRMADCIEACFGAPALLALLQPRG